jgi:hypothetical protein
MKRYAGILALVLAASSAHAEAVHGSWKSYEDAGRCHAVTIPTSSEGGIARSAPYLAIQNVPADDIRGSVAIVSGNEATGEGDVRVEIDGKAIEVLPFKDSAFAASGRPEAALVTAMRRGHELKVEWSLKDGTKAADTYDLAGFSAAKQEIDSNCR